jgi:hypothetical protein
MVERVDEEFAFLFGRRSYEQHPAHGTSREAAHDSTERLIERTY